MKFRFSFMLASAAFCVLSLGCFISLPASEKGVREISDPSILKELPDAFDVTYGNGNINNGSDEDANVKKTVTITDFTKISASRGIKVILIPGKFNGKAQIATTESAAPYLKVTVDNNCLKVRYEGSFRSINGPSIVTVQTNQFSSASLSSAASLEVQGNLKAKRISFHLSSAANVSLCDVVCDAFDLDLSSASKLSAGVVKCDNVDIDVSSASNVEIDKVKGNELEIDSSSASRVFIDGFESPDGDLEVDASSTASVHVNGINCRSVSGEASSQASITFRGKCATLSKETSSGGSIKASDLKSAGRN